MVSSTSSSFNRDGPIGKEVLGGVGDIEGNFRDGGRTICAACAGSDDGGINDICEAAGSVAKTDDVGVRGDCEEAEEGFEVERGAAAINVFSLSSEDTELSSGVAGIGDADAIVRGRRGTFVGCCEWCGF